MHCANRGNAPPPRPKPEPLSLADELRRIEAILEERCPVEKLLTAISEVIMDLETDHEAYVDAPGSAYRITRKSDRGSINSFNVSGLPGEH